MKLVVDTIEFATNEMPRWNSVSVSGYHIREAGSTAAQELAFTLMDGFTYIEESMKRGLPVDTFAPRISHFLTATAISSKRSASSALRGESMQIG